MFQNSLNVQGQFKFEVYNSDHKLLNTTILDNFITNTGIKYLETLAFADCFRYISLGSGINPNSIINGSDTTGISGYTGFQYIGANNKGYLNGGCGYTETCSGIILSKGWMIPTGGLFFDQNYNFQEFMLSPGAPDPNYNSNNSPPCTNEYTNFLNNNPIAPVITYGNICNYTKAFTRLTGLIAVSQNNYMIVYYNLNISTNTGINFFGVPITQQASVGSPNWLNGITGYYTMVHHGLKLVNNGSYNFPTVSQPFNVYESICDSINQPLGSLMEPSTPIQQIVLYLSTDNTQFLVSPFTGGAMDTGLYYPYNRNGLNFPSGTENFQCSPTNSYITNMNQVPIWLYNTRQGNSQNIFPLQSDYRTSSNNTSIAYISNFLGLGGGTYNYTSNKRTGIKNIQVQFPNTQVAGNPIQYQNIRSMVLAYSGNGNGNLYPVCDFIFEGTTGNFTTINTGNLIYSDLNNYNSLDGDNNLTLSFQETWTSPCNSNVIGC